MCPARQDVWTEIQRLSQEKQQGGLKQDLAAGENVAGPLGYRLEKYFAERARLCEQGVAMEMTEDEREMFRCWWAGFEEGET